MNTPTSLTRKVSDRNRVYCRFNPDNLIVQQIIDKASKDRVKYEITRARSSAAERPAHNRLVAGSNPAEPIIRDYFRI